MQIEEINSFELEEIYNYFDDNLKKHFKFSFRVFYKDYK